MKDMIITVIGISGLVGLAIILGSWLGHWITNPIRPPRRARLRGRK